MQTISDELYRVFSMVAKRTPGISSAVIHNADVTGAINIAAEQRDAHTAAAKLFQDFIDTWEPVRQDFDADQDSLLDDPLEY